MCSSFWHDSPTVHPRLFLRFFQFLHICPFFFLFFFTQVNKICSRALSFVSLLSSSRQCERTKDTGWHSLPAGGTNTTFATRTVPVTITCCLLACVAQVREYILVQMFGSNSASETAVPLEDILGFLISKMLCVGESFKASLSFVIMGGFYWE